jgi:uncharacterized protein
MAHIINWFEIPVSDFERGKKFYESILQVTLDVQEFQNMKMAFFPGDKESVSGSLCYGEWYTPSPDGTVIYLNANPDLSTVLDRVVKAGGNVIMPKKEISPEYGFMALFHDSEGNRIALHSMQ